MTDKKHTEEPPETGAQDLSFGLLEYKSPGDENLLKIREDLDRIYTESQLAQADVGKSQFEDMLAMEMNLPSLALIGEFGDGIRTGLLSTIKEIEQLFSLDAISDTGIELQKLKNIFENGITSAEQQKVIRSGMKFLKRRMYSEAAEWWLLNRPEYISSNSYLHLILTLLLVLTYKLSGNEVGADSTLAEAKENPLFGNLTKLEINR